MWLANKRPFLSSIFQSPFQFLKHPSLYIFWSRLNTGDQRTTYFYWLLIWQAIQWLYRDLFCRFLHRNEDVPNQTSQHHHLFDESTQSMHVDWLELLSMFYKWFLDCSLLVNDWNMTLLWSNELLYLCYIWHEVHHNKCFQEGIVHLCEVDQLQEIDNK